MTDMGIQPSEKYVALLRKQLSVYHDKLSHLSPCSFEWDWRVGLILNINNRIDSASENIGGGLS